jgi:hypothetical protein
MSGGHFDYKQAYLGYITDQLERDIAYNAIPYDAAIVKDGEKFGLGKVTQIGLQSLDYR